MSLDPKQQIAQLEAQLARAKERARELENGQKYVIGGMLINAAKRDTKIAAWAFKEAQRVVKREEDVRRISSLMREWSESSKPRTDEVAIADSVLASEKENGLRETPSQVAKKQDTAAV